MNLTTKQMLDIMIKTGTSNTDFFSNLGMMNKTSNDMRKGKIKVTEEVTKYLIDRLHANKK
jgi:hypothetical protein|tara:strand:+ start:121 stop:303 length:183 start_codon:yes stop_codon:yes gene_type:complete